MKTLFSGYYQPSLDEFKALWSKCTFSYDTNVLRNLYRYPEAARNRFLQVIERLIERSILTFQAASEYQEGRIEQLAMNLNAYRGIEEILEDSIKKIQQFSQRHPFLDREKVDSALEHTVRQVKEEIRAAQGKHPKKLADTDPIHERLGILFEGKISKEPTSDELASIYKEGESRYQKSMPPGYEDAKKPKDARKYGDLIIWKQLMEVAREVGSSIVFVTDDRKEDWWQRTNGETIGPRPELRQEFKKATGQDLYIYQPVTFLQRALEFLEIKDERALIEIKGVGLKLAAERRVEERAEHYARSEYLRQLIRKWLSRQLDERKTLEWAISRPDHDITEILNVKTQLDHLFPHLSGLQTTKINNLMAQAFIEKYMPESRLVEAVEKVAEELAMNHQITESDPTLASSESSLPSQYSERKETAKTPLAEVSKSDKSKKP